MNKLSLTREEFDAVLAGLYLLKFALGERLVTPMTAISAAS